MPTDSAFLDIALDLAKKSGAVMKKNFTTSMKKEWKSDNTPITETDRAINDLVVPALREAFPSHSVLSEEEDGEQEEYSRDSEYVWICDPVDGTHNFSHGIPTATFALALTKNGKSILGVVYDPFLDRIFYAEKDKGAFMNGEVIRVSESPTLTRTVVGMGKINVVRNLFPLMQVGKQYGVSFITGLSIHYMTALVAAGEFSASFFGGTSSYDMTAGKILVEEAGGKATDLFGEESERYDRDLRGQLCSNGIVHDQLFTILNQVSPL